ncbi:phospholipase D-like domain-containing protein [Capnocytophaga cynodegmi]|uniref:phospholipase D-like domain-containing protein n=1 Tax=Capnocytophaga cynodegmi TaxID=28189 RepID=UPI001AC6C113|nr:phospholipase D-like domain-containing protein [Capnocytophaga cynodegmi]GIM55533.1 hypothetical protein CAPN005_21800 [Capnocytophaga cynodegmi]
MEEFNYELPSNEQFLETLKEYTFHKGHSHIVNLLKKSSIKFSKTNTYTGKIWNTYWCSIMVYIPSSELSKVQKDIETTLKKYCSDLLPPDCGYLIQEVKFVPSISTQTEPIQVEVFFEEQKKKIIDEIKQAKYLIWIAVAWFTLEEIYDLLVEKSNEGLAIRIIVSKDEINNPYLNKYKDRLQILAYPKFGQYNDNLMHNKFCIIDLKKAIHGSYNWSKRANYNRETVEIVEDRKIAENFSEQFKKLYLDLTNRGNG